MNEKKRIIGIDHGIGKLGNEMFTYRMRKPLPQTRGLALETGIPSGLLFMLWDDVAGCPAGWKKLVLSGADYYVRLTDSIYEVGKNAYHPLSPPSLTHNHTITFPDASGPIRTDHAHNISNTTPTITYPAVKYLLCERI